MNYSYTSPILKFIASIIDRLGALFLNSRGREIDNSKIKKIIFVKVDNIGDCFLTTPIFQELKKINNGIIMDVLCLEASKEIFANNNSINSVICIKNRSWSELLKLKKKIIKEHYDIFIDARGYAKVSLLGFISGVRIRMGFMEEVLNCLYTHKLNYNKSEHESKKYKAILDQFDLAMPSSWIPQMMISIPKGLTEKFKGKIIAIHPGASLDYKRWPVDNWINLLGRMLREGEGEIALLGSKNEIELNQKIYDSLLSDRIINLAGEMNLSQTYGFLSLCSLFMGSDSALGHLSGPQEIPTVILMNSVIDQNRWKPLGSKVRVIIGKSENHKCLHDKCQYPCANMKSVTVDEVFDKITNLM